MLKKRERCSCLMGGGGGQSGALAQEARSKGSAGTLRTHLPIKGFFLFGKKKIRAKP